MNNQPILDRIASAEVNLTDALRALDALVHDLRLTASGRDAQKADALAKEYGRIVAVRHTLHSGIARRIYGQGVRS